MPITLLAPLSSAAASIITNKKAHLTPNGVRWAHSLGLNGLASIEWHQ